MLTGRLTLALPRHALVLHLRGLVVIHIYVLKVLNGAHIYDVMKEIMISGAIHNANGGQL